MRWYWFLLPILAAGGYLFYAYATPHSYVVTANVPVAANAEEAAGESELDMASYLFEKLGFPRTAGGNPLATQVFFFYFSTPHKLESVGISPDSVGRDWRDTPRVRRLVRNLSVSSDPSVGIVLRYEGSAVDDARRALTHLAQQLTDRIRTHFPTKNGTETGGATASVETIPIRGGFGEGAFRGAVAVLLLGLLLVFVGIVAAEMLGRALSSERQVSRYLGVEVVGALPRVGGKGTA